MKDADHYKQAVSAVVTAAALLVPGVGDFINSIGGPTEVVAVAAGLWGMIHATVNYIHARSAS